MGEGHEGIPDGEEKSCATDASTREMVPPEILDVDHVYAALSHPRRRYLWHTLLEDTTWSLTELATEIAAWENEVPEHAVRADQCEAVYVSLYHAHVPKLVDEGVVTFDAATETITIAEHADQVLSALEGIGGSLDSNQETHARSEIDEREE